MRRIILAAAVAASGAAGLLLPQAAHAQSACVSAHVNVNGSDVVNQTVCVPPQ